MNNYEVAKVGALLASKILDIEDLNIEFINQNLFPSKIISAMFIKERLTIVFNEDWLWKSNHLDIMQTAFHEVRHAFQFFHTIKKTSSRLIEDEDLIDIWRNEFNNYQQPTSIYDLYNIDSELEIDAVAFSVFLTEKLLNTSAFIHPQIRLKVLERIKLIEYKLYLIME